jgi:hypothetical protein
VKTYVDDTEDESILRPHGEVATVSIARDRGLGSGLSEQLVHLFDATNLVRGGIDGEHEHKDDGEEDGGVGARRVK